MKANDVVLKDTEEIRLIKYCFKSNSTESQVDLITGLGDKTEASSMIAKRRIKRNKLNL